MIELLNELNAGGRVAFGLPTFLVVLALSFAGSWLVAGMYRLFYGGIPLGSGMHRAFLLIGPSITLLFICVQMSLPLSLGLLGALSIVRFRTPVKEPEEIGFLLLLISMAIGLATLNLVFVGILLAAVFVALWIREFGFGGPGERSSRRGTGRALIVLPTTTMEASGADLLALCREVIGPVEVECVTTTGDETELGLRVALDSAESWMTLLARLRADYQVGRANLLLPDSH